MKTEIVIPTSLSEIPLKSYQEFMKVVEKSNDEEFIGQKTIEIFCGLKMKDVVKVKWSDVKSLTLHLNEIFKAKPKFQATFKIKDMEFGFIPNLNEMSYGEYLDLSTYFKDMWVNMPTIMSILYRPVVESDEKTYSISTYKGTNENTEELFKEKLTMDIVWGAIGFFLNLQKDLLKGTLIFLAKEMKNLTTDTALLEILTKNGQDISQLQSLLTETSQNLTKLQP